MELLVSSLLATVLMMLIAGAWATFGRPALEVEARARISQEAILATQSLTCDLGGSLADSPGRTGALRQYSFVDWDLSNNNLLLLNFHGATPGDLIVISYQIQENKLVRVNSTTGVVMTIANYVTGFSVAPDPDNANQARIQLTIAYRNFTATYVLIAVGVHHDQRSRREPTPGLFVDHCADLPGSDARSVEHGLPHDIEPDSDRDEPGFAAIPGPGHWRMNAAGLKPSSCSNTASLLEQEKARSHPFRLRCRGDGCERLRKLRAA